MKLSPILGLPPKFHFWKDFGAGKKKRMPVYKWWHDHYRGKIEREKPDDYTLKPEQLPPGSRLMDAKDFMQGHIDLMPDELIKLRDEGKELWDHPWPFNVRLDPIKSQDLVHHYNLETRFYVPREDCLVLTNTILETDSMQANPPFEMNPEQVEIARRHLNWAMQGDSILAKKPRRRQMPRIDQKPRRDIGIHKHRSEMNTMSSLSDITQLVLAQHLQQTGDKSMLDDLFMRQSLCFPKCNVPLRRSDRLMNLDLCIDSLSLSNEPLPVINSKLEETKSKAAVDIKPRSWKSILEKTRSYSPDWSFSLPTKSNLHTIQLCSRIRRDYRDPDEMFARAVVHSFGLAYQFGRFKEYAKLLQSHQDGHSSKQGSVILQNPLNHQELQHKNALERPIVLQAIAFDQFQNLFHFLRYQLNTTSFDDQDESRLKNQVWYSGPVEDLEQVLRYYLDFQSFNPSMVDKVLSSEPVRPPENHEDLDLAQSRA